MNSKLKFFSLLICTMAIAISSIGAADARPLNIVTTTADLGSITEQIAGRHAKVTFVCNGDRDAHYLEARPSFIILARDAELWIRVGMELEIGWEPVILDSARNNAIREGNPRHLDASEKVLKIEVPTQRVTRAMGDVHPSGNPHYWLDPLNIRIVAQTIADRLKTIDSANASDYDANLAAFQKALDVRMFGAELVERFGGSRLWALELRGELDSTLNAAGLKPGGWVGRMRPLRGKSVVTYHKNWGYFANRFGMTIPIELEPKPGIPPSPAHIVRVVDLMKAQNIDVILMASIYSRRAADNVAARTGANVVVRAHSVGGTPEAKDIFSLIDEVVDGLVKAFGR